MTARIGLALFLPLLVSIVFLANQGRLSGISPVIERVPFGDALGHFVLMGAFAFLATGAFGERFFWLVRGRIPMGAALVCVVVLCEEVSQLFIDSRTFSMLDLAADFLGILLFGWLTTRVYGSRRGRTAEEPSE